MLPSSRVRLAAAGGVAVLLVIGLVLLVERYGPPPGSDARLPALSVHSSREGGARALSLWLSELGYHPTSIEYRPFGIDRGVRTLFVLAPGDNLTEAHASEIARWVEGGGTLVLVADRSNPMLGRLGLEIKTRESRLAEAVPRQPLFRSPAPTRVEVRTRAILKLLLPVWVPLLGAAEGDGDTIAAVASLGRGRAYALAALDPLSNAGLNRADNWKLVLHFLAGVPAGATVAFDEYHHGFTEHGTFESRLFREPWGWAVLYSAGLLFAYVALRGRRFGRAVAVAGDGARRSRMEYVATLASLLRQGKHRGWLCERFAGQVKRALGSRFGVRADLPAEQFVAALVLQRPEAVALAAPLSRLERGAPRDDKALVALVREVDVLRDRLLERNRGANSE